MKILLLEDDPVLSELLLDFLNEHYRVQHVYSSDGARKAVDDEVFDLYLFDINVPGSSGLSLLEELRSVGDATPVIMITAYQDIGHLRKGFDYGCNDYLRKPFDLEELLIRIESIQRRQKPREKISLCKSTVFDPQLHEIVVEGLTHHITPKESEILLYMVRNARRLVTADELMQNIWEYDNMPSDTTLRGYIKHLRDILGKALIKTVRGEGYIYDAS